MNMWFLMKYHKIEAKGFIFYQNKQEQELV